MTYQSSWIFSAEFKNKFLPTYYSSHNVMTLPWCIIFDHVLIFYIATKLFVTLIPAMEIKVCQQNEESTCTCTLSPLRCFATPMEPTRFCCLWNFPGKNTTVGYHFLTSGGRPHPGIEPAYLSLVSGFFTIVL